MDLLEGRVPRHRPGRRRDARHPDGRARRAGSGTSRCTTTSSASAWWPAHDYLFKDRGTKDLRDDLLRGSGALPGRASRGSPTPTRCDIFRAAEGVLVPGDAGGRRRLGAGRRRVRVPRPAVLVRRVAGADQRVDGGRRHRRRAGERRHVGGAAAQVGAGVRRRHGPDAAAGVRVLRRLQLRPVRPQAPAT